jgi:hypothetical protein
MDGAQALADCAGSLGEGLSDLQATVTTGNPWGSDGPGTMFGAIYLDILGHAIDTFASHADLLVMAAQNLAYSAEQLVEADGDSARTFTGMSDRLGG